MSVVRWLVGRLEALELDGRPVRPRFVAVGLAATAVLLGASWGYFKLRSGLGTLVDVTLGMGATVLFIALFPRVIAALVRVGGELHNALGPTGIAAFVALLGLEVAEQFPFRFALVSAALLVVLGRVLFSAAGELALLARGQAPPRPVVVTLVRAAVPLALVGALALWLFDRGSADETSAAPRVDPIASPVPLLAANSRGPYSVSSLDYGDADGHRGVAASAWRRSRSVDARPLLGGPRAPLGWRTRARQRYWGFDFGALPLAGRVYFPQARSPDERLPVVVVVPGNHSMMTPSHLGYAYLAELWASRGFVVTLIDENFLNLGGPIYGELEGEFAARAWLTLKHLELFRDWDQQGVLPAKLDFDRVALVGHSRGGEAAALAAAFNRLPANPDDSAVSFAFGFGIRGVILVATTDGGYRPSGRDVGLEGISLFAIHDGHDADSPSFGGDRAYNRARPRSDGSPGWFKASLYIPQANHGQFNTLWGDTDIGPPAGLLLNRRPLLPGEQQRAVASLFATAFLEATLHDDASQRAVLKDYRTALAWLPQTPLISRFEDTSFELLSDFDDDLDLTTLPRNGRAAATGLAEWREGDIPLRGGDLRFNTGVFLAWEQARDARPSYAMSWPNGPGPARSLVLHLAATEHVFPSALVDLTVELSDAGGRTAALPLSRFGALLPPLASRFARTRFLEARFAATESNLQTFHLPLKAFADAAPGFQTNDLRAIRLVFDRTPRGGVVLDRVGLLK